MPMIALQFDGDYGVYHSMYDDFYWMNKIGDPGYRYHTLMSQLWGVLALRLGNADLLPFDYANYAANVRQFITEMAKGKDLSQLDLQPVMDGINDFEASGTKLDNSIKAALAAGKIDPALAAKINQGLMQAERNWLNPDGIPGRPWFKHILYGARFTYAHLELPGLTEAVEKGDWATARQQAAILERAIANNTQLMTSLNAEIAGKN
jgi:N-acetylated-alpha-linked acidic dipeptidase